jgi:hypothetical protein
VAAATTGMVGALAAVAATQRTSVYSRGSLQGISKPPNRPNANSHLMMNDDGGDDLNEADAEYDAPSETSDNEHDPSMIAKSSMGESDFESVDERPSARGSFDEHESDSVSIPILAAAAPVGFVGAAPATHWSEASESEGDRARDASPGGESFDEASGSEGGFANDSHFHGPSDEPANSDDDVDASETDEDVYHTANNGSWAADEEASDSQNNASDEDDESGHRRRRQSWDDESDE